MPVVAEDELKSTTGAALSCVRTWEPVPEDARNIRKEIFPGLQVGYRECLATGDCEALQAVAEVGREHWPGVAREMLGLHRAFGAGAAQPIARLVRENYL